MDKATTISAANWATHEAAQQDVPLSRCRSIHERLLEAMDPQVARSFTEDQVRELERALALTQGRRLPIDIRISVPFFRRGFFVTLLAGPERRSAERLKVERAKRALWTFWNTCCFVFLVILFVPTLVGLVHILVNAK